MDVSWRENLSEGSRVVRNFVAQGRIRRREFIAGVGGIVALPLYARAQSTMLVMGFLSNRSPDESRRS